MTHGGLELVKDKELLERQRRFTQLIPELKELFYPERLDKLNLWSLEERRVRDDLIEVYKVCLLYRFRAYLNLKTVVAPEDIL